MNSITRTVALFVTSAAAATALAAQPEQTTRIEIVGSPAAARAVLAEPGQDMHFQLENGRLVRVSASGEHLQLAYRFRSRHLKHDGQGGFVSGDGRVQVRFELDAAGRPDRLTMTAPASWF